MGMIATALASLGTTGAQVWARVEARSGVEGRAIARWELRLALERLPLVAPNRPLAELMRVDRSGIQFLDLTVQGDESSWHQIRWTDSVFLLNENSSLFGPTEAVEVTFFGQKSPRSAREWSDDWRDATLLPRLIKIETTGEDGRANPPLTIEVGKDARYSSISPSSLLPPG